MRRTSLLAALAALVLAGSASGRAASGPSCTAFAVTGDVQQAGTVAPQVGLTKLTFTCKDATAKDANHQLWVTIRTPDSYPAAASIPFDDKTSEGSWVGNGHERRTTVCHAAKFTNGIYAVGWINTAADGSPSTSCGLGVWITTSLNVAGYGQPESLVQLGSASPAIAGCHVPGQAVSSTKPAPKWLATAKAAKAKLPRLRDDEDLVSAWVKDFQYAKATALLEKVDATVGSLRRQLDRIKDVPAAGDPAGARLTAAADSVLRAWDHDGTALELIKKADAATGDAEAKLRRQAESELDDADAAKQHAYVELTAAIAAAG